MQNENTIRLRDRREPGHFWADNEIFDVFGDELGASGIGLYMTLARLAFGTPNIRASQRGLGLHARMGKDTVARALLVLVRLGLVVETKALKSRSMSVYSLTNAKELAREYVRSSVRNTVSVGDSEEVSECSVSVGVTREMTYLEAYTGKTSNCLPERQIGDSDETSESETDVALGETDLSQKTQNLSHQQLLLNKNKKKEKELPPTPRWGDAWNPIPEDEIAKWRDDFETANYFRAKEGRELWQWEAYFADEAESYGRQFSPQPPPDAEFAQCATSREAANLVMRRCSLIGDSVAVVIAGAIDLALANGAGKSAGELGERAWKNYTQYQRELPLLTFRWGVRNFFRGPHWLDQSSWPRSRR